MSAGRRPDLGLLAGLLWGPLGAGLGIAHAEAPATDPVARPADPAASRSLWGRRFLLSDRVPHPFVVRAVTFRQGAALVRIPDAAVPFEGGRPRDLLLVAAVERVGLAVPVSRRVGAVASVNAQAMAGANGASALLGGARAGFDWETGATVVVLEVPRVQLSVNPRLYGAEGVQLLPMSVVSNSFAVAEDAKEDATGTARSTRLRVLTSGLVTPIHTVGLGLGLAGAWRVAPRVGVLGGVRLRAGQARVGGEEGRPVSVALGAAADWRLVESSPLIGKVEYRYQSLQDAAADSEIPLDTHLVSRHHVGAGLFWRGRLESELGLSA